MSNPLVPIADLEGDFSYAAGTLTSSGTVTGSGRCIGISVFATTASDGSFRIGSTSNDAITVRGGFGRDINPMGNITDAVVRWGSGTLDVVITSLSS